MDEPFSPGKRSPSSVIMGERISFISRLSIQKVLVSDSSDHEALVGINFNKGYD